MRKHWIPFLLFLCCIILFSSLIIHDLTNFYFCKEGVLSNAFNYFVEKNFHWTGLNFHTDMWLYPFEIDDYMTPWSFELHLLTNVLPSFITAHYSTELFYYIFSLLVTFFTTYFLITKRKGRFWGTLFAFFLTFCNYAAICKFPDHFQHSTPHWAVLSVLTDAILIEKYWGKEKITAIFVQGKILLIILCFGLEMGYIAGFACCSFFVVCCYILIVQLIQDHSVVKSWQWIKTNFTDFFQTYLTNKWNFLFSILILLSAWIYLPIVLQIMLNAPQQGKTVIWRTCPLRIFLPIFPGFHPAKFVDSARSVSPTKDHLFAVIDTIYAWNAGWTFLLLFFIGLCLQFKSNFKKWIPFVLLFLAMLLMYHVPILSYFPAFKYARIPERLSPFVIIMLLIPLYFSCRELSWRKTKQFFRFHNGGVFVILLTLLFCVELTTAYSSTFDWAKRAPLKPFPQDYKKAVQIVKSLPGDAIFFYPFSAHGGDGIGYTKYHYLTAHQMQFAGLCRKKMNGVYIGRMSPQYLTEFEKCGLPLFLDFNGKITEDFVSYWKDFFKNSNFAALILYTNYVPEDTREQIYQYLGKPIHRFEIFGKNLEIIPIPDSLRANGKNLEELMAQCTSERAAKCIFKGYIRDGSRGLEKISFNAKNECYMYGKGFSEEEPWGTWSDGANTEMWVAMPENPEKYHSIKLTMHAFLSKKGKQEVEIKINDVFVKKVVFTSSQAQEIELPLPKDAERCLRFDFTVSDPTSSAELGMSNDTRKLGFGLISLKFDE